MVVVVWIYIRSAMAWDINNDIVFYFYLSLYEKKKLLTFRQKTDTENFVFSRYLNHMWNLPDFGFCIPSITCIKR